MGTLYLETGDADSPKVNFGQEDEKACAGEYKQSVQPYDGRNRQQDGCDI